MEDEEVLFLSPSSEPHPPTEEEEEKEEEEATDLLIFHALAHSALPFISPPRKNAT